MNYSRCRIIVILAVFGVSFSWAHDETSFKESRFVEVTGEAKITTLPDQVRISLSLETRGRSAKEAQEENSRQTQTLLSSLKKAGAADKDMQTTLWNVRPVYNYDGGKKRLLHYEATKTFSVLLNSVDLYGPIMEVSMQAGVERIEGVEFLSSKKDHLEDDARKLAAVDAKKKAEALANVLGQKVGKPLVIVESGFVIQPTNSLEMAPMRAMKSSMDSVSADEVAPGEIFIEGSVRVKFELE